MLKKSIKKITRFRPRVRSRHSTHDVLRDSLPLFPFRSVIRLGSTSEVTGVDVQVNTVDAVRTSANKLLMKQAFTNAGVQTADWFTWIEQDTFLVKEKEINISEMWNLFPNGFVMKHIYGSRGTGNYLIKNIEDWEKFKNS